MNSREASQENATLLDVLVVGFEKNEIMDGFHWRNLPMPNETSAVLKFAELFDQARRWKAAPREFRDRHLRLAPRTVRMMGPAGMCGFHMGDKLTAEIVVRSNAPGPVAYGHQGIQR